MTLSDFDWLDPAGLVPTRRRFDPVEVAASLGWMAATVGPTCFLVMRRINELQELERTSPSASFWSMDLSGWPVAPFFLAGIAGPLIVWFVRDLADMIFGLALALAFSVVCSPLLARSYHGIADGRVLVHPVLPWERPVSFSLLDATVEKRGCHHVYGRHDRNNVIFQVRYGQGERDTINLGEGVGSGDVVQWLKVMSAYDVMPAKLTSAAATRNSHDATCITEIGKNLDALRLAALRRLLD